MKTARAATIPSGGTVPRLSWRPRWSLRGALVAVLLVGLAVASAPAARAHARLTGSDPAEGQTLTTLPGAVSLSFNESINPTFTTVAAAVDGGEQTPLQTAADGRTVTATFDAARTADDQAPVPWVIAYRVVSDDGHPIEGTVSFSAPAGAPPPPTAAASPPAPATTSLPGAPEPSATAAPPADQPADGGSTSSASRLYLVVGGLAVLLVALLVLVWHRGRPDPS
jgi:methionine-rich copper-binding protein CopC